jgi:regulatory protein YycH of two-component signal transduction system YycFG
MMLFDWLSNWRLLIELNEEWRKAAHIYVQLQQTVPAGKVSDKTKDQTDMMKLMTDMQRKTIRFTKIYQPA